TSSKGCVWSTPLTATDSLKARCTTIRRPIGVRIVGNLRKTVGTSCSRWRQGSSRSKNWLIRAVRYDRERRILEVHLHAAGTYQHFGVSLELALKLVRSPTAGKVYQERISRNFPFKRVVSTDCDSNLVIL